MKFVVETTQTGYSAYAEDFEKFPIGTTGDTLSSLKENLLEAANLYLDYVGKKKISPEQIEIEFDIQSFFDFYGIINAKALSRRIGMSNVLLSQYVNGAKKPSSKQVAKIAAGLREVGKELAELQLA